MDQATHSLPAVLVLGTLVAIFFALQRKHRSTRVRLWVTGWCLIFLRFAVDLVPADGVFGEELVSTFRLTGLSLAGFVFLVSVTRALDRPPALRILLAQVTFTCVVYSALISWQVATSWPYIACLLCTFMGGAAWIAYGERRPIHAYLISLGSVAVGTWAIIAALRGHPDTGLLLLLLSSYGAAALLFLRAYRRATPGLLATSLGLAAWAAVWAVDLLAPTLSNNPHVSSELWNAPKFVVAFGMILLLLEEESHAAEQARDREQQVKTQVQRFADITSQLLMGQELRSFCGEIAQALVEATTFERVAILLADQFHTMHLTGYAGLTDSDLVAVKESLSGLTVSQTEDLCARGRLLGRTAVICAGEQMDAVKHVRTKRVFPPNPHWQAGDELTVPLRSRSGKLVGVFSLDDPRDVTRVTAAEMSTIEILATDLAVAIENADLQRQLVQSEKMAGIGQLVGGVAHELNNPLAVVLGYSELLAEHAKDNDALARGLESIRRESLRMKQIIANLQHFARASKPQFAVTDLAGVLREACAARKMALEAKGVAIELELEADLPSIGMIETQVTQVLSNVLTNAAEATEGVKDRRIRIEAKRNQRFVVVNVIDNGPGFTDTHRAFDPFFTTKGPGKGTGLGLSICYGLIRQQGGCISAHNLAPHGACVTIELPIVNAGQTTAAAAAAASNSAETPNGA